MCLSLTLHMAENPKHNDQPIERPGMAYNAPFEKDAAAPEASPAPDAAPQQRTLIHARWMHLLLAGVSAVLLGLSFPEPGWWPLAWIALVPIGILAARSASAMTLAWTSYLVFLVWWLVMVRWLSPVTVGGFIGVSAFVSLYPTLAVLGAHWLHRRYGAAMTWALPLPWVSMEFLRGHLPEGGFGWFALAHTQAPYLAEQAPSRVAQIADLFGEFPVSFLIVMTSGLIVDLLTRPLVKPAGEAVRRPTALPWLGLWAVLLGTSWLYGQWRISEFGGVTRPGPRIAVIQTNVAQDNKNRPTPEQEIEDWKRMLSLTLDAARVAQPSLIVWPETMVPAPLNPEAREFYNRRGGGESQPQFFHEQISLLARSIKAVIVAGSHTYINFRQVQDELGMLTVPDRYNSVFAYDAKGAQAPVHYAKIHLVPFGEYIPWIRSSSLLKELFINYLSPYPFDYSLIPGSNPTAFDVQLPTPDTGKTEPLRVATPICFEDVVGRVTRMLSYGPQGEKRADVLVNLTNSAWYPESHQQPQHLQIAVFRSIENRLPTARSVNYGISGFIDSVGRVGPVVKVDGRSTNVPGYAYATVRLDSRQTLWGAWGEWPAWIAVGFTGLLILGGLLRRDTMRR